MMPSSPSVVIPAGGVELLSVVSSSLSVTFPSGTLLSVVPDRAAS